MKEEKKLFYLKIQKIPFWWFSVFFRMEVENNKAETEVRQTEGKVNNTKFTQTLKR